jgi:hypothetical protein
MPELPPVMKIVFECILMRNSLFEIKGAATTVMSPVD